MAMTNDAFLDQMKKDLEAGFAEDLPAKYSQVKIGIRDVEKLQGESYRGISFRVGDAPIEGNLNMQQAYQAHEAGVPYESILRDTQEAIMQQVDRMPQFNIGEISNYESMKANLMMELIPQKGNEERLAEVPHQKVEDMALIYRMDMGDSPSGKMTSVVTNQNMLAYGITAEQLHQDPWIGNTKNGSDLSVRNIGRVRLKPPSLSTGNYLPFIEILAGIYPKEKRNGEPAFTKHSVKIFKGRCRM